MIKIVIDKSQVLLDCFGYQVSSNSVTQNNVTSNSDSINTISMITEFSKTDSSCFSSAENQQKQKIDSKSEVFNGIEKNKIETISSSLSLNHIKEKVVSTAARTLEVLPLTTQTSTEWRRVFSEIVERLESVDVPKEDNEKDENVNNICTSDKMKNSKNENKKNNHPNILFSVAPGSSIPQSKDLGFQIPGLVMGDNTSIQCSYLTVNEPYTVRLEGDLFGRGITEIRMSYTNGDLEPFQTN